MSERVAIYYTPAAGSPLSTFAAGWLGRDVVSVDEISRPNVDGLDPAWQAAITRSPRRYGFHGTLKAPFTLAGDQSLDDLHQALANFVAGRPAVTLSGLELSDLYGFVALVPATEAPAINDLAAACVETFERYRAPLSPADLERRRQSKLTCHQDELLVRWGYPYVMEEFRFHLTLSEFLELAERQRVMAALRPLVQPYCQEPLTIDAVSLLLQNDRQSPFVMVDRFPLSG